MSDSSSISHISNRTKEITHACGSAARLLGGDRVRRDQVFNLSIRDAATWRMELVNRISKAGATSGSGFTRLRAVGLCRGKSLFPPAQLEPVVRKSDFSACAALGLFGAGLDRFKQVVRPDPVLRGRCNHAPNGPPVSDPVSWTGYEDIIRLNVFNRRRRGAFVRSGKNSEGIGVCRPDICLSAPPGLPTGEL